jgi:predicted transcriptional regulator
MRPPALQQSALRHPLNAILGREANVRILRVLALESIPIGRTEIARQAQLQARGMKKLLATLEDIGAIEVVARGRQQSYRLSERLGLMHHVKLAFSNEHERARQIMDEFAQAGASHGGDIKAAWIEGPVAERTDRTGDVLVFGVLAAQSDDGQLLLRLRDRMNMIQRKWDIAVELRLVREADLESMTTAERAALDRVQPVWGPPPRHFVEPIVTAVASQPGPRTHAGRDAALHDRARQIADKISRDQSIITRAIEWIDRRLQLVSPGERLELTEWKDILTTMSAARVRRFLVQPGERATRLRQSMPFVEEAR